MVQHTGEREPANIGKGNGNGRGKGSIAPVASICEGKGTLDPQTVGVALPASGGHHDLPRADIRSWLMDTGCKHDLTTRDSIPYCQIGMIEQAQIPRATEYSQRHYQL